MARGKYGRKYGRTSGRGFKRGRKSYGKKRYGKTRVPSGTRYVRGAMRTAGSYAVGQARAELKYCDSLLNNVLTNGGGMMDYAVQSRAQAAGTQANTNGTSLMFTSSASTNPVGSNYAGLSGQPGILLNNITQGADAMQRIGRKIQIKSIRIRCSVQVQDDWVLAYPVDNQPNAAYNVAGNYGGAPQSCRLVIVWDKQPNGQQATSADVFTARNGSLGSDAMMNLDKRDRFVILADETRPLSPGGNASVMFDIYKECDLTTIYSSAVDPQTIASIQSGALYGFFLSDKPTVKNPLAVPVADAPTSTYNMCRLRYLDM